MKEEIKYIEHDEFIKVVDSVVSDYRELLEALGKL